MCASHFYSSPGSSRRWDATYREYNIVYACRRGGFTPRRYFILTSPLYRTHTHTHTRPSDRKVIIIHIGPDESRSLEITKVHTNMYVYTHTRARTNNSIHFFSRPLSVPRIYVARVRVCVLFFHHALPSASEPHSSSVPYLYTYISDGEGKVWRLRRRTSMIYGKYVDCDGSGLTEKMCVCV